MKEKIRAFLHKQLTFSALLDFFVLAALSIYTVFPIVNLIRREAGGALYFTLWRDWIFYIAAIFVALLLIVCVEKANRENIRALGQSLRQNPVWFFLAALAVWMILSTGITGFVRESVIGGIKSKTGLICSIVYLLIFAMTFRFRTEKRVRVWLAVFLVSAAVINVAILINYFFFGAKGDLCHTDMIFYNSNHIAYYLLVETVAAEMVFLLSHHTVHRWAGFFVYVTGVGALLRADALGCLIALVLTFVFALIVLLLTQKFHLLRFVAVILAAAAVFCLIYFVPNSAGETEKARIDEDFRAVEKIGEAIPNLKEAPNSLGSGRLQIWRNILRYIEDEPIFGYGLARVRLQLLTDTKGTQNTAHNEFLEYASNHGIPALLFYLGFIFTVFIRGARHRKSLTNINVIALVAAFAYLVSSFFGVTMFYTAPYLFLFLALGYYKQAPAAAAPEDAPQHEADETKE